MVAVSGVLRDQLLASGVSPGRAHVLHNGVDTDRFRPDIPGLEVRARLGLDGKVVIGFVGSFAAYHGVDLFLEAAARVAQANPDVVFLLVGGRKGNLRYEGLRAETGRAVRPGAVVFAGEVPHTEIPGWIAAMDATAALLPADQKLPISFGSK